MSHSSGIPVSKELQDQFDDARSNNNLRFIKAEIHDEKIVPITTHPLSDSLENDWNQIQPLLDPKNACYIIFRLDTKNLNGYEWLLGSFVPDGSPVKDRMLYASTRDYLKRQLGYNYFGDELHGTLPTDFDWDSYAHHHRKGHGDAPLTEAEVIRKTEVTLEIDPGHTREYVHSVAFPISPEATSALRQLLNGSNNLVQLRVDPNKETIELRATKSADIDNLSRELPDKEPCFSFFRYDHDHDGENQNPIVFIYSSTDDSPIKLKMLYSTVKVTATGAAEQCGVKIVRKFEISDATDLTRSYIHDDLHPPEQAKAQAFSRPSRPGKGRSRITRAGDN